MNRRGRRPVPIGFRGGMPQQSAGDIEGGREDDLGGLDQSSIGQLRATPRLDRRHRGRQLDMVEDGFGHGLRDLLHPAFRQFRDAGGESAEGLEKTIRRNAKRLVEEHATEERPQELLDET